LILHRDAATSKIKGFTSVDICCHLGTASFHLFLPQFCHHEMGQAFLIVTRHPASGAAGSRSDVQAGC